MLGCPRELALAHLLLRLRPLERALRKAIAARDASARKLYEAGAIGAAITRAHADALLDQLGALDGAAAVGAEPAKLSDSELTTEHELRASAREAGVRLPLDALADAVGLDVFEQDVLVLCASVEVDSGYEQVLAYVQDDATRRVVSIELACGLMADSLSTRIAHRASLGAFGRLRRHGLLAHTPRETGLRDELRVTPSCAQALFGAPIDLASVFRDPGTFDGVAPLVVPADAALVARAAHALREERVDVVAVWGRSALAQDIVASLAAAARLPVRRYVGDAAQAVGAAAALGAMLWIDLDTVGDAAVGEILATSRATSVPIIVSGTNPWRPSELLAEKRFVEIVIEAPDFAARRRLWQVEIPELEPEAVDHAATAFHFDATEIRAAGQLARTLAALHTNGHVARAAEFVRGACLAVARKHGERHTTLVVPRRRADDLVLPPDLHERVLDLVRNFRAMPRVMNEWGFARRVSGGGLKGLFTGEPGTGKTMAAEVIANELGLPMLRVDLARVVSKWIGETEKNLDHVFNEARDSHAVLFFDEAEALFGARGDVRHGTDRYANLEVSYLLQRFEDHGGIVILATNLRDKIDQAFMRRFHVVVGFPRPGERERKRIWQRTFQSGIPVTGDLDFSALARLDLTGAGIVGAAQAAALLAAHENANVSMRHVVRGLVRQYQREARVLSSHDLGVHAVHMSA